LDCIKVKDNNIDTINEIKSNLQDTPKVKEIPKVKKVAKTKKISKNLEK